MWNVGSIAEAFEEKEGSNGVCKKNTGYIYDEVRKNVKIYAEK